MYNHQSSCKQASFQIVWGERLIFIRESIQHVVVVRTLLYYTISVPTSFLHAFSKVYKYRMVNNYNTTTFRSFFFFSYFRILTLVSSTSKIYECSRTKKLIDYHSCLITSKRYSKQISINIRRRRFGIHISFRNRYN